MTLRWIGLVLVGIAAVASLLLPIDPAADGASRTMSRSTVLRMALTEADRRVRIRDWADSLGALVVAADDDLTVGGPVGMDPDVLELERVAIEAALSGQPRSTEVAVGAFTVLIGGDDDPLQETAHLAAPGFDRVVVLGRADGRPYCISLRPDEAASFGRRNERGELRTPTSYADPKSFLLGGCWIIARFGVPGPGITGWLDHVGMMLQPAARWNRTPSSFQVMFDRWQRESILPTAEIRPRRFLSPGAQTCLAGDATMCARLVWQRTTRFDEVRVTDPSIDLVHVGLLGGSQPLPGVVDPAFVSRLEEHFGPDRFREFWTSDLELEPAFEAAFGISLGRYVMERAHETYGEVSPGPGVDVAGWWGLLIAVAIGLGSGALVSGRRRLA